MKTLSLPTLAKALLCLAVVVGLSSCSSPLERRIANNPTLYQKLADSDKVLINQGRIREGMTKEAVFLSWGRPDQVAEGSAKGVKSEKWTYMGSQPVYVNNVGFGWGGGFGGGFYGRRGLGYGYGGLWDPYWGGYGGPAVTYVPYKVATVDFRGNRVTGYLRGRQ